MARKQFLTILLILIATACSRSNKMQRGQQQYDVVQEGTSTQGVTSTINAPGETPQPLTTSTVTATNADTTTAFTAVPGVAATATTTQQPGTIASTLPDSSGSFPSGYSTPRPRPRPKPVTPTSTAAPTSTATPPTTTSSAPTATDTVAPTTTDTSGPKKKDDQKPAPPPPSDTTGTQG
jgi:hypothetical protein